MATDTYARIDGTEFKDAEKQFRTHLTPGLPAVIRLDGRAFYSYTKGLQRLLDERFVEDMDAVAVALAEQIDGVRLVYTQSDEISLLLTDRVDDAAQGFMFGGQVQKLTSISAAIATATLNARRLGTVTDKVGLFDSRAFSLPDMDAVQRYLRWRQADARVNSLSMLASTHFSHRQLHGVGNRDRVRMLRGKGIDPLDLPPAFVHGRVVLRSPAKKQTTYLDRRTGKTKTVDFVRMEAHVEPAPPFEDGLDDAWF